MINSFFSVFRMIFQIKTVSLQVCKLIQLQNGKQRFESIESGSCWEKEGQQVACRTIPPYRDSQVSRSYSQWFNPLTLNKPAMPTNKNAAIRYQALDKCFRDRRHRYYLEDLIDNSPRSNIRILCQSPCITHKKSLMTKTAFWRSRYGLPTSSHSWYFRSEKTWKYSNLSLTDKKL